MKTFSKLLSAVACLTILLSCSNEDDPPFGYSGVWEAKYKSTSTEVDSGTAIITVNTNGNTVGIVTSQVFTESWTLTGSTSNNGQITLSLGTVTSGANFTGSLNNNQGQGTWNNNSNPAKVYFGTWTAIKQ